jgi:hypothetical protein
MPGSGKLEEKVNRLPVAASAPEAPAAPDSAIKRGGTGVVASLFVPLAVEVVYSITRKWLAGAAAGRTASGVPDEKRATKAVNGRASGAGRRHRYRNSQDKQSEYLKE